MSHDPTEAAARLTEDLAALDPGQEAILLRNSKGRHVGSILIDDIRALIPLAARVAELEGERALIEQAIDTLDCPTWSDVVHAISILQVRAEQPAAAPDRAEGSER